jgi:hypothetical protein
MKNILKKLVPAGILCALALLVITPASAVADTLSNPGGSAAGIDHGLGTGDFTSAGTESSGLSNTLLSVAHYALYVFYLLGIIFMGVAAIKFKNGDMEAMGKNLGGSVCLFLVPKIVETLISWSRQ